MSALRPRSRFTKTACNETRESRVKATTISRLFFPSFSDALTSLEIIWPGLNASTVTDQPSLRVRVYILALARVECSATLYFHLDKRKFVLDFLAKLSKIVEVNRLETADDAHSVNWSPMQTRWPISTTNACHNPPFADGSFSHVANKSRHQRLNARERSRRPLGDVSEFTWGIN